MLSLNDRLTAVEQLLKVLILVEQPFHGIQPKVPFCVEITTWTFLAVRLNK